MSSSNVEEAALHAVALMEKYSECDLNDACWHDPEAIFSQLKQASRNLKKAASSETAPQDETSDTAFRAIYLEMVTDAFSNVLEETRSSEEEVNVQVLSEILSSGMDFMSMQERELFLQDFNDHDVDEEQLDDTSSSTTPRERQGRDVSVQS